MHVAFNTTVVYARGRVSPASYVREGGWALAVICHVWYAWEGPSSTVSSGVGLGGFIKAHNNKYKLLFIYITEKGTLPFVKLNSFQVFELGYMIFQE